MLRFLGYLNGEGHPDSHGGAVFFGGCAGCTRRMEGRSWGCSPLQSLSAGSEALWMENVGGGGAVKG